ncbi:uncharacterized protein LOC135485952 [Lineus longissimus]|uniref:uncharacterized protein LOC135485952 n=1 Tax=Lineus longissimus TaxID=88925 RepID=UPI00315DBC2B
MLVARDISHNAFGPHIESKTCKMAASIENHSSQKTKRERKPNFSHSEAEVLADVVINELGILRSKFSSDVTNKMKKNKWDEIALMVSSLGVATRTGDNCREKWNQQLSKAKEIHSLQQKHQRGTGGGGKMPQADPTLQRIIETFEKDAAFRGITGGFESAVTTPIKATAAVSLPVTLPDLAGWTPVNQAADVDVDCSDAVVVATFDRQPHETHIEGATIILGARKAHAKGLLTDAMCRQKTQQDVFNMQLEVLEATLVTQKATTRTQEVLQKEAGLRIEKLQLEIALLKEKEFLGLSGIEL